MRLKVLTFPVTFVLAVLVAYVNGLDLPESLLVGAWFTVPLVLVLPMPPKVAPSSGAIVVGAMVIWPESDHTTVGAWTTVWLVLVLALGVATVWTWLDERRNKNRAPTLREQ